MINHRNDRATGHAGWVLKHTRSMNCPTESAPAEIVARALHALIATQTPACDPEFPDEAIVFLDWRDQIMLYFDPAAPPADIRGDIMRLLGASKIR